MNPTCKNCGVTKEVAENKGYVECFRPGELVKPHYFEEKKEEVEVEGLTVEYVTNWLRKEDTLTSFGLGARLIHTRYLISTAIQKEHARLYALVEKMKKHLMGVLGDEDFIMDANYNQALVDVLTLLRNEE